MTTNYVDSGMKYRKKPVVIEASQWFKNGDHPLDYSRTHDGLENGEPRQFSPEERKANNWEGDIVRYYRHPEVPGERTCTHCEKTMHDHGWIDTLEGGHIVCPGDWIITGVQGEQYPCKPEIFAVTYEPVVQGEPVAEVVWPDVEGRRGGFRQYGQYSSPRLPAGIKLYTHPQPAPDVEKLPREAIAELIKGMAVSVDVSTGESDFGNRYFGVVDEVQWSANERHGMMLLVKEPEANFATSDSPDVSALVELLAEARDHVVSSTQPVRGGFIDEIDTALAAHRKQGGGA